MEKHKYEYEIDPASDSAGARVLALTPKGGKVLELGAGPGSMTRHLTGLLGCSVVALEVDESAVERLRSVTPQVRAVDLNGADWDQAISATDGTFDAAIAADGLEVGVNRIRSRRVAGAVHGLGVPSCGSSMAQPVAHLWITMWKTCVHLVCNHKI